MHHWVLLGQQTWSLHLRLCPWLVPPNGDNKYSSAKGWHQLRSATWQGNMIGNCICHAGSACCFFSPITATSLTVILVTVPAGVLWQASSCVWSIGGSGAVISITWKDKQLMNSQPTPKRTQVKQTAEAYTTECHTVTSNHYRCSIVASRQETCHTVAFKWLLQPDRPLYSCYPNFQTIYSKP